MQLNLLTLPQLYTAQLLVQPDEGEPWDEARSEALDDIQRRIQQLEQTRADRLAALEADDRKLEAIADSVKGLTRR